MSKNSKNSTARIAALGLKVIRNLAPVNYIHITPPPYPRVAQAKGKSDSFESRVATLAQWLEEQYHANLVPFHFLSDVPLNMAERPEKAVIEGAIALLQARGWQILGYLSSGVTSGGSLTMMHPDSVGF